MLKNVLKFKKKGGYAEIDGKLYRMKVTQQHKESEDVEFVLVKDQNILKKMKEIAQTIKDAVKPEDVIQNALYDMSEVEVLKLYKTVTSKKFEKKPVTKVKHGCMELHVGKIVVPLRD